MFWAGVGQPPKWIGPGFSAKLLLIGRCWIGTPRSVFELPGWNVTVFAVGGGLLNWAFVKLATVTRLTLPRASATHRPGRNRERFNMLGSTKEGLG
jgi:hypothetical protein